MALAALIAPLGANAWQTNRFSPQGEVASVRQVVAQFDAPAVQFGDPKAPAPFAITCSDAAASQGSGVGPASANGCLILPSICRPACAALRSPIQHSNHPLAQSGRAREAMHSIVAARMSTMCGTRHLASARRRPVFCPEIERPRHSGKCQSQRLVQHGRCGRAHRACALSTARSAANCSRRCALTKRPRRRRSPSPRSGPEPAPDRWQQAATGGGQGPGHAQRRGHQGRQAL